MSNKLIARFNNPDTLGVISSFPVKGGEIARANAISRYTFLLTNSFPKNQKVVVFSEKRKSVKPYLLSRNILVAPSYKVNSPGFLVSLLSQILRFNRLPNFLIQFEFSVFGGKIVIPQILMLLFALKLLGKSTKIMFHQVVADINTLYGHLAIKKDGLKAGLLNVLLRTFYSTVGIFSEKIFVHDGVLAARIANFVDGRKIRIIPHGITRERKFSKGFEAASKAHFGIRRDTKLIGLFGYCSWYKGTDWLIENFARFAGGNPGLKVKLLVAGGESPTLKGTLAYEKYHQKLKGVIKEANGNIVYTGFVPEKDVRKVFAAVDLFIFPYRTKMSASGAFSLCLGYGKQYLVSKAFSENLVSEEAWGRMFHLNHSNFENVLKKGLSAGGSVTLPIVQERSWETVASLYLAESLSGAAIEPKLNYAEAI